ncbi:MAG: squalene synthase HpnC [Alphaproteobacteria bacterium]
MSLPPDRNIDPVDPPPGTRTATSENFPVGSVLLPRRIRPVVAAFYHFARTADDVADDPSLSPEQKLALLDAADDALLGDTSRAPRTGPAQALRQVLLAENRSLDQPRTLLEAFRRDSRNPPTRDWADLMDYCRLSAAPVGRFLLELHDQSEATYPAADALCAALQVLNHIQDCRDDYRAMRRVYVPANWLAREGLTAECLGEAQAAPGLLRILDEMLDGVDTLLAEATPLSGQVTARGLRLETSVIRTLAMRLSAKLRGRDPLRSRIALGFVDWTLGPLVGAVRGLAFS